MNRPLHAVLLPALMIILASLACERDPNHRLMSDAQLIERFRTERASFDRLAEMFVEDRDIRMVHGYAKYHDPNLDISEARWAEYEQLLRRTGVGRNVWSDSTGILFEQYVKKSGPIGNRWMRGYYYARPPVNLPGLVLEGDLMADATSAKYVESGVGLLRHIEGPWYLYSSRGYTD